MESSKLSIKEIFFSHILDFDKPLEKLFESFGITVGIKEQISLFPITFDWGRVECCINPHLNHVGNRISWLFVGVVRTSGHGRVRISAVRYTPHPCKRRLCKLWRKLKMFRRSEKGRNFSSTKKRFTVSWKNFTEFSKEDTQPMLNLAFCLECLPSYP